MTSRLGAALGADGITAAPAVRWVTLAGYAQPRSAQELKVKGGVVTPLG